MSTDCSSAPPWYSSTIQPSSIRSLAPSALSKSASCQTVPFRAPTPGMPPTAIETLALAVCCGVFHVTTPVFVTIVPIARFGASVALKRRTIDAFGGKRAVRGGVVGRDERPHDRHPARRAIQRRRRVDIGELARRRNAQIVRDHDVGGRHERDVLDGHDVFEERAGDGGAAADHRDLLRDQQLLTVAHHDHRRLRARGRVAVAVGQHVRHLGAAHHGLVADERAPGHAGIRPAAGTGATAVAPGLMVPAPGPGNGGVRSAELIGMPATSGETPAIRLSDRQPVEGRGVRDVGRVRGHAVGQRDTGRCDAAAVVDGDRVAEHVARIDDVRRARIDEAAPRSWSRTTRARWSVPRPCGHPRGRAREACRRSACACTSADRAKTRRR